MTDSLTGDKYSLIIISLTDIVISTIFSIFYNLLTWKFRKLDKNKTMEAAFVYLIKEKNKPGRNGKVPKIACIDYENLKLQEYLHDGNKDTKI